MDGVKEVLARKGINIQEVNVSLQNRKEWHSICRECDMLLVSQKQDV